VVKSAIFAVKTCAPTHFFGPTCKLGCKMATQRLSIGKGWQMEKQWVKISFKGARSVNNRRPEAELEEESDYTVTEGIRDFALPLSP
jgi:hypothetical protein